MFLVLVALNKEPSKHHTVCRISVVEQIWPLCAATEALARLLKVSALAAPFVSRVFLVSLAAPASAIRKLVQNSGQRISPVGSAASSNATNSTTARATALAQD